MYTCRVATAATAPPFWENLIFELVPKPGQLATNGVHYNIGGLLAHVVVEPNNGVSGPSGYEQQYNLKKDASL